MTESSAKVTVIIPNWNGLAWLPQCLEGLTSQVYKDFSVILVDNGSSDHSLEYVQKNHPQVSIISFDHNRGFSAAVNAGIQASSSEYIALLNTDAFPKSHWLFSLINAMDCADENIGALSSKMLDMSKPKIIENTGDILSWQGAAVKRGKGQPSSDFTQIEEIFSPCAGAVLYRKSFLEKAGGFDEQFFAYLEDVDLGLRGRLLGYRFLLIPTAEVLHRGHGSNIPRPQYVRLMTRNRLLLFLKNIPAGLLLKNFFSILYGQFYFLVMYRKPFQSFRGYLSFLALIPHMLKKRRSIKRLCRLSRKDINALLVKKMPEPPLCHLIAQKLKRYRS